MVTTRRLTTALSLAALAAVFTTAPMGFDFGTGLGLKPGYAFAKDGRDDDGGGRDDHGGDDRGGRSGDDEVDDDHGGHGGDDAAGDDHGGRGGDDEAGDDHGGRGGDDEAGDDHGGRGGDDAAGDDRGGRGRGRGADDNGDDGRNRGRGRSGNDDRAATSDGDATSPTGDMRAVKFEGSGSDLEIIYSNGLKEEVENGRYQLKDASGRTVVERAATATDISRIRNNARISGVAAVGAARGETGGIRSVEATGTSVEIRYTTGWKEEIEGGRYELKDPNGNTVVERTATAADQTRLAAIAAR